MSVDPYEECLSESGSSMMSGSYSSDSEGMDDIARELIRHAEGDVDPMSPWSECDGPSSDTDSDAESLTVSESGSTERSNSYRSDSDQFSISESSSADHSSDEAVTVIHPSVEKPLYPGSEISVFQSHLLLYQFFIKHGLTNEGCMELLTLLNVHLPSSENLPKSAYTLKQFFTRLFPDLVSSIHYYCSCCHRYLVEGSSCGECAGEAAKESFISVPLQAQLKRKMEGIII